MKLRNVTIGLSKIILVGMICFLGYITSYGGFVNMVFGTIFALCFCGFPPIVSMVLSVKAKSPFSHIILATASLLYGIWFAYAMFDAFYVHVDPQSAIVIVFVGIYALPVLLPLWILAVVSNSYYVKFSNTDPGDGVPCDSFGLPSKNP